MKARPLQALIPSGRVSSAAVAATALCRPSAPPYRASWAAWPGMSLPGPRGLPSVLTSVQGGPPMFASVLTLRGLSGMVEAPNIVRRRKRLPDLPRAGKSLVAYIPAVKVPAGRLSGGLLSHIGRAQRPVSARTGGLTMTGERCALPSFFPKHREAFMIPTITATLRPAVTALPCNLIPAGEVRHG